MGDDKLDGPAVRPTKRSPKVEFAVNAEKVEVGEFIIESVVYCGGIKSDIVTMARRSSYLSCYAHRNWLAVT